MGSTSTKLRRLSFSTAGVPAADRFAVWRDSLSQDYELILPRDTSPLTAWNDGEAWAVGSLIFGIGRYSAHELDRTTRRSRASQLDHYKLHLRIGGEPTLIEADGKRIVVAQSQMCVTDMSRPEHLLRPVGESITLFIAREALDDLLPRPLALHGVTLEGISSDLLSDHLQMFARTVDSMSLPDARLASEGILRLLAASLAPQMDRLADGTSTVEAPLLRQICRYIDLHLPESGMAASRIAELFGLSRATLYRLFEPLGGVSYYILERRLARVHELLEREPHRQRLKQLAERHGFKSAATLSRAFIQRFGYAPTTTLPLRAGTSLDTPDIASVDFARWMRSLGA